MRADEPNHADPGWIVRRDGKELPAMPKTKIIEAARRGNLRSGDEVRRADLDAWEPASIWVRSVTGPPAPRIVQAVVKEPARKACAFCAEMVLVDSIKCRHCGEFLDGRARHVQQAAAPISQTINVNVDARAPIRKWNPGIALVLAIFPGAGQFYKGRPIVGSIWCVLVVVGYWTLIWPGIILHFLSAVSAASGDPAKSPWEKKKPAR